MHLIKMKATWIILTIWYRNQNDKEVHGMTEILPKNYFLSKKQWKLTPKKHYFTDIMNPNDFKCLISEYLKQKNW